MFKSYLKLALRNIWKRKTSTVINVLGLSIGLASCILVVLFFLHELQFDKGFDNGNDIYRVTSSFDDGSGGPTVAMPFAKYLKSDIPEIEDVSRLDTKCQCIVNVNSSANNSTPFMVSNGYWVDTDFFKIFSFHFLYGDRNTALNAPNTIVLSRSLAQKFFSNNIPLGKTLKTAGSTYTVSGVFKEDILNHLKPDFFASNNSAGIRESDALNTSWVINPNYYTYIKLRKGSDVTKVEAELKKYTIEHATADMKSSGIHMTNGLQSMAAIHLHSSQWPDYISVMQVNLNYMYLLGSIALAILILGCINYMNLSSAQAIDRAREVGVRRVMGASKYAIRIQFIIETLIISLVSMLLAMGLALLFLQGFNTTTNQDLNFFGPGFGELMICVLLIALMTGLLAGIYPALYLSSFRPVKVLKGKISDGKSVFSARKVLVSVQFIISTFLIFATLIIWQQFDLLRNTKPGFDQDQQLVISEVTPASQANSSIFISQLSANPVFKSVTGATGPLFSGDMNFYAQDKTVADKHDVYLNYTDVNYLPTLNLKLVSGTNFNPEPFANKNTMLDMEAADMARQVILNEQAVQILGLNAYNAPGHYVMHRHNGAIYTYRIMGVVKDFHYQSAHNAIGPYGMVLTNPIRYTTVVAKIQGKNVSEAIKFATQKWKELNPDAPFNYDFMDKTFSYDYDQDQRQQTMLMFYTAVAIFISAIGLLGLITYTLGQKAREIGIRKVIGASVGNIVMLFYKQYFILILIANAIALPLAWYYMSNWLSSFPYRIHISWWMFLAAVASGVVIAFCTIAFRTVRAALANPVESLRAE